MVRQVGVYLISQVGGKLGIPSVRAVALEEWKRNIRKKMGALIGDPENIEGKERENWGEVEKMLEFLCMDRK